MLRVLFSCLVNNFKRNLPAFLVLNLLTVLPAGLFALFFWTDSGFGLLFRAGLLAFVFIYHLLAGTLFYLLRALPSLPRIETGEFFGVLKSLPPDSFVSSARRASMFGMVALVQTVLLLWIITFYLRTGGISGLVSISLFFWLNLFWQLSAQYHYSMAADFNYSIFKTIRQSLILCGDNLMFSVIIGVITCLGVIVSLVTLLLFPGLTGIIILHEEAFRMLRFRHEYLRKHPGTSSSHIPWQQLLPQD